MPSFSSLVVVAAAFCCSVTHAVEFFSPEWVIPANIGLPYPPMTVNAGDTLTFSWPQGTHDVWIYPSGSCEETGKIQIGSFQDNPTTYTFSEADAGQVLTFVCDIGSHCEAGMIMDVTVLVAETTDEVGDLDGNLASDPPVTTDGGGVTVAPVVNVTAAPETEVTVAPEGEVEGADDGVTAGQFSLCYVCGEAEAEVSNPETIVSLPNPSGPSFDVSCAALIQDGLDGIIPNESCSFISQYANIPCGCTPQDFSCNICGTDGDEDLVVMTPDQEITLPYDRLDGVTTSTCGEFFEAGKNGELNPISCQAAPVFALIPCQCAPVDFSCSICGEGFKVNAPGDEITLPSGEIGTCGDLEAQGASGELGPSTCFGVSDFALSTGTCSCIPEEGYPECAICGMENTQPMTPDVNLTLAGNDIASCASLYEEGLAGELSPFRCLSAQAQALLGCNCAPVDFTCNVCGGNGTDIAMTIPETNFTVPGAGILVNCGILEAAGLDGTITPSDCSVISPLVQTQCGCAPVGYTCNICGDDSGLSVTDENVAFVPQNDITCAEAEAAGLAGELDPNTCDFYQTLARRSCLCEEVGTIDPSSSALTPVATVMVNVTTEAPVVAPVAAPVAASVDAPVTAPVTAAVGQSGTDFLATDTPVAAPVAASVAAPVAAPVAASVEAVPGSVDGATGSSQQATSGAVPVLKTILPALLGIIVTLLV